MKKNLLILISLFSIAFVSSPLLAVTYYSDARKLDKPIQRLESKENDLRSQLKIIQRDPEKTQEAKTLQQDINNTQKQIQELRAKQIKAFKEAQFTTTQRLRKAGETAFVKV